MSEETNPNREPGHYTELATVQLAMPVPQHDYILVMDRTDLEHRSRGGIIMPNVEDPTGNKRSSAWAEVIAVGPGAWVDRADPGKPAEFARRPPCCQVGDLVVFQGGKFLINVPGGQLTVIQDYQVCAIVGHISRAVDEPKEN